MIPPVESEKPNVGQSRRQDGDKRRAKCPGSGTQGYLGGAWTVMQMVVWDRQEPPVSLGGALSHGDVRRGAVAVNPRFLAHGSGQISLMNSSLQMSWCKLTSIT